MHIDKGIWKFGLWKTWISFKELKARASNAADKTQMDKYGNAIKMLRLFKWLTVLLLILNIIIGLFR